jgi:hypothetical protein
MRYTGSGEQNELLKNHLENWSKEGADVRGVHSKLSSLLKDASASFSGTLDKLLKFPVPEYYGRTPNQCEKPKTKGSELK